jgi:predicted ATPase/class 3 adenylate cyclase
MKIPSTMPPVPEPRSSFTFLFTDIEGSTRLWEEHAEEMTLALARHDTLLSEVFSSHGGHIFKMMGDSVLVAFREPSPAVRAAVAAQHALAAEEWETPRPIRVRVALHRGLAEQRNADYFGPTLNRTARLLAAGHGGQVLLSRAVHDALDLDGDLSLRDLGERRLRDLTIPEHIYQVLAPGLPRDFPPLRSLEVLPNNLPAAASSFIGRERETAEVKRLLSQSRLVTLLGPGGTGKTRLSLEVAAEVLEQFSDGVWLVELATMVDPDEVLTAVAAALGLREERERPLHEILHEYVRSRQLLLILDNCEHLIDACARLAASLMRAAPRLRILASSREALGVPGESAFSVLSLAMPDVHEAHWTGASLLARLGDFPALQLFEERGSAVQPAFRLTEENALTIAKICWRLDGIPLAIELAAARLRMLTPEQIYRRLDDRFRLLTSGARTMLPRQQTLTALIDWSYDLLSEKEQMLLRRSAVFARGRTLRALEAVCAGDGLEADEIMDLCQQLVDKSLFSTEEGENGRARYVLLESIWEYARAKLENSGETARVSSRHLDYFLRVAEETAPQLTSTAIAPALAHLAVEHVNFRMALEWSAEAPEGVERGLSLAAALGRYWEIRSHLREGRDHLRALLGRPEAQAATAPRAYGLRAAGRLAWCGDDDAAARRLFREATALFRQLGLERESMLVEAMLGFVEWSDGYSDAAEVQFLKAELFARERGDTQILAMALSGLGSLAASAGELAQARAKKEEGLALYRTLGDEWVVGLISWSLARVVTAQGELAYARTLMSEALALAQHFANEWLVPSLLDNYAVIARNEGNPALGVRLLAAAEALRNRLGVTLTTRDQADTDRVRESLRAQLPAEEFTRATAEGARLPLDEILQQALAEPSGAVKLAG